MADKEAVVDVVKQNGKGETSWRDELVLDIDGIRRRDMTPYIEDGLAGQKKLLARVVKQMPKEWGGDLSAPGFKVRYLKTIMGAFGDALQANKPLSVEVTFDLWDMPMSDYEAIDASSGPAMLAKYVTHAPKQWGPVDDVNTWLDLPQPVYLAVQDAFKEALNSLNLG